MKNKKLKMMVGVFLFIFLVGTFLWKLPRAFAEENISISMFTAPHVYSANQLRVRFGGPVASCVANKFHLDVNDGGVSPETPISCAVEVAEPSYVVLTFASDLWWHDDTTTYAQANGLYLDAGAVTAENGIDTNIVVAHGDSIAVENEALAFMESMTKDSNTQITVTFSEMLEGGGCSPEAGNSCGFTVKDAANPQITYEISGNSQQIPQTNIRLTVADFSASAGTGITVTYNGASNALTASNHTGVHLATDSTGLSITEWQPPTMSSAVVNSNTQVTVTFNEGLTAWGITKANDGGFTVVDASNDQVTYAVSAVAAVQNNTSKAILTVANMAGSAANGVKIKYATGGNGGVHDLNNNFMVTDAVGVTAPEFQPPTLLSAVKDTTTQISVTLSELADSRTITKSNDSGFVVTQVDALTTFSVSAVAPGETNDIVVLTVADMSAAESAGVKVTYTKGSAMGGNGLVTDANGNYLATDSTGVSIAAWATGRRSSTVTTTTDTGTGSDSAVTVVIPTPTVTATYGQTQTTTVSAEGTTAAMSFGSAVSFPVNGASVSVSVSSLANPAEGTASVVVEVGAMASAKLKEQRLKAQSLKLDLDLKVGVPKQVDVDGDGVMDLEINLEEVVSITDVKITIKTLEKASIVDETVEEPKVIKDYTDGKWVKDLTHSAVYFIDKTNVRHIYLTKSIWSSYFGDDFSRVMIVPTAEILSYTIGESVPFKAGSLIKTTTSPKVYQVDVDGTLQWMVNEMVAKRIVGTDWAKLIVDVSETILGEFKVGVDLE
jgi:hypothetical protein